MALIRWYPLDGNTDDYTVNQDHGINNNVTWVNGKIGQAGNFNGTTSKITVSQVDLLSEWSVSVWIKPVTSTKTYQFLFGNNVVIGDIGRILIRRDGYVAYSYPVNTYKNFSLLTADIVGSWNHLVFIANNTGIDLYLNGVYNSTVSQVDPILNFAMIGNAWSDDNWATEGQINDVRIYDHALSQKEINDLAKAKVLHYTFNKDEDIVYDNSGYKRNGNKINSPVWTSDSKLGSGTYEFNGINNYISRQTIYTGNTFSVFVWVHPQSAINGRNVVIANGYPYSGNMGWLLCFQNNNQFFFSIGADTVYRQSIPTLPINEWSFIGAVVSNAGSSIKLYINGVEVATTGSGSAPLSIDYSNATAFIGRRNAEYFNGKMDEFQVYQTALSDSDILDLYQTRAKIDNHGNLYVNEIVEDYEVKPGLTLRELFEETVNDNPLFLNGTVGYSSLTGAFHDPSRNQLILDVPSGGSFSRFYITNKTFMQGRQYFIMQNIWTGPDYIKTYWRLYVSSTGRSSTDISLPNLNEFQIDSHIAIFTEDRSSIYWNYTYNNMYDQQPSRLNYLGVIDLTTRFGEGNEPSKEQMESWYRDYIISRPKSSGIMKTREFNEVGIDTIAYEGKTYRNIFEDSQVVTQIIYDRTGWTTSNLTITNDNPLVYTGIVNGVEYAQPIISFTGNLSSQYYGYAIVKSKNQAYLRLAYSNFSLAHSANYDFELLSFVSPITNTATNFGYRKTPSYDGHEITIKDMGLIDLSAIFTVIPTKDQMDTLYQKYRQLKTTDQKLRIAKNMIVIDGSIKEG